MREDNNEPRDSKGANINLARSAFLKQLCLLCIEFFGSPKSITFLVSVPVFSIFSDKSFLQAA
jgi:hypothetical protein